MMLISPNMVIWFFWLSLFLLIAMYIIPKQNFMYIVSKLEVVTEDIEVEDVNAQNHH